MKPVKYTIRNKKGARPIVKFSPSTLKMFDGMYRESVAMVLHYISHSYRGITGKSLVIDHEQDALLNQAFSTNDSGVWTSAFSQVDEPAVYTMCTAFSQGIVQRTLSLEDLLAACEQFYSMVDAHLGVNSPKVCFKQS